VQDANVLLDDAGEARGTVTGGLFSFARSLQESKRSDMREMGVAVKLAGVMGGVLPCSFSAD
jgi:hypothetical protein